MQLLHRLERVRHILIGLDLTNDLCSLGPLSEVDELGFANIAMNAVLDEGEIGQVDA